VPDGSAIDGSIPAGAAPAVPDRRVRGGAGRRGHGAKRDPEHGDDRLVSLTARERHVAALAGQGLTNQEIAERLLITPSTVEQHLTRVFRKLGITGRAGLPGGPLHAGMPEASTS
jgi:DNA-binding CsgD family transcriptional regulator